MRWAAVWAAFSAGCVHVQIATFEPVLALPVSTAIGSSVTFEDPERVEATACGLDYRGLDELIAEARGDRDVLVGVTLDIQRVYGLRVWPVTARRIEEGRKVSTVNPRRLEAVCYTLRADRVTVRVWE